MGKLTQDLMDCAKLASTVQKEADDLFSELLTAATNVEQLSKFVGGAVDEMYLYIRTMIEGTGGGRPRRQFRLADYKSTKLQELSDKNLTDFMRGFESGKGDAIKWARTWWQTFERGTKSLHPKLDKLNGDLDDAITQLNRKKGKLLKSDSLKQKIPRFEAAIADLQKRLKAIQRIVDEVSLNQPPDEKQLNRVYDLTMSSTVGDLDNLASRSVKATMEAARSASNASEDAKKEFRRVDIGKEVKGLEKMAAEARGLD